MAAGLVLAAFAWTFADFLLLLFLVFAAGFLTAFFMSCSVLASNAECVGARPTNALVANGSNEVRERHRVPACYRSASELMGASELVALPPPEAQNLIQWIKFSPRT